VADPKKGMPAPADLMKAPPKIAAQLDFDDDDTAASTPGPARMDQLKQSLALALKERDEARRLLAEEKARADRLEEELKKLKG
jgi:hypothetical protein